MDACLQFLYNCIINDIAGKTSSYTRCPDGLYKLIQEIEKPSNITFNFNEKGKLNSKYLNDRYEPAIILQGGNYSRYYYLFDGEIKDCIHPSSIVITKFNKYIIYYSSERIKQELPINIAEIETNVVEIYNQHNSEPIIAGYKWGEVVIDIVDYVKKDYLIHECMEPAMPFKFAD